MGFVLALQQSTGHRNERSFSSCRNTTSEWCLAIGGAAIKRTVPLAPPQLNALCPPKQSRGDVLSMSARRRTTEPASPDSPPPKKQRSTLRLQDAAFVAQLPGWDVFLQSTGELVGRVAEVVPAGEGDAGQPLLKVVLQASERGAADELRCSAEQQAAAAGVADPALGRPGPESAAAAATAAVRDDADASQAAAAAATAPLAAAAAGAGAGAPAAASGLATDDYAVARAAAAARAAQDGGGGGGGGGGGQSLSETHLVPLVPDLVPGVDHRLKALFIAPPDGLLELGRRRLLLQYLEVQLGPYLTEPASAPARAAGIRCMPTLKQLERAKRGDLIRVIRRAGGFQSVALALGLRSSKKPVGYWESPDALDLELTLFVAAHWAKLPVAAAEDSSAGPLSPLPLGEDQLPGFPPVQAPGDGESPSPPPPAGAAEDGRLRPPSPPEGALDDGRGSAVSSDGGGEDGAIAPVHEEGGRRSGSRLGVRGDGFAEGGKNDEAEGGDGGQHDEEGGDSEQQYYYYNPVSGRLLTDPPQLPEKLPLADADGESYLLLEEEADRVMPSRAQVMSAGRYDLHHAIRYHGGYRECAAALHRRPAWPRSPELRAGGTRGLRALGRELRLFARQRQQQQRALAKAAAAAAAHRSGKEAAARGRGGRRGAARSGGGGGDAQVGAATGDKQQQQQLAMPTSQELLDDGRMDLLSAVYYHGGFRKVAAHLGLRMTRRERHRWRDVQQLMRELWEFLDQQQQRSQGVEPASLASRSSAGAAGGFVSCPTEAIAGEHIGNGVDGSCGGGYVMPTFAQLRDAGRADLAYGLTLHTSARVAALMGIPMSSRRGRGRGAAGRANSGGASSGAEDNGSGGGGGGGVDEDGDGASDGADIQR